MNNKKKIEITSNTSYYKNMTEVNLLQFVSTFKEKTMQIYNSILKEERIIFLGYEITIDKLVNFVNCCAYLVYPLNI